MPLSSAVERRSLKANVLGSIPRGAANAARGQGGYGPVCKTGETSSFPVRASKTLQWLERRGTDLLNRHMLVRIQSGAPLFSGPRSSKDERRSPTSEDARSNRVAVGKLESELGGCPASPAKRSAGSPVRIVLSTLRQINAGMAYWGACLASNQEV